MQWRRFAEKNVFIPTLFSTAEVICTSSVCTLSTQDGNQSTAAARHMRDVLITEDVGVLSKEFTHPLKLKVCMTQKLVFDELDNFGNPEVGPFRWSPDEILKFKHDEKDGIKLKDMAVAELREVLKANVVDFKGIKVDLLKDVRCMSLLCQQSSRLTKL